MLPILLAGAAVVGIGGGLVKLANYYDSDEYKEMIQNERKDAYKLQILAIEQYLDEELLSCFHCKGLSFPVWNTRNKYECLSCRSRFANTRHDISSKLFDLCDDVDIGLSADGTYFKITKCDEYDVDYDDYINDQSAIIHSMYNECVNKLK